jgi:hypothetical protein
LDDQETRALFENLAGKAHDVPNDCGQQPGVHASCKVAHVARLNEKSENSEFQLEIVAAI